MQEGERITSEAYQAHMASLLETYARQARFLGVAGVVSPYVGVRAASMALAGSDPAHVVEFEGQAEACRYELIHELNQLHMHEVPAQEDRYTSTIEGAPSRLRIGRGHFAGLPVFGYRAPAVAWAIKSRTLDFVLLAFTGGIIAFGFFRASPRLPAGGW